MESHYYFNDIGFEGVCFCFPSWPSGKPLPNGAWENPFGSIVLWFVERIQIYAKNYESIPLAWFLKGNQCKRMPFSSVERKFMWLLWSCHSVASITNMNLQQLFVKKINPSNAASYLPFSADKRNLSSDVGGRVWALISQNIHSRSVTKRMCLFFTPHRVYLLRFKYPIEQ